MSEKYWDGIHKGNICIISIYPFCLNIPVVIGN